MVVNKILLTTTFKAFVLILFLRYYSKSLRFGFLDGSFDKNPKVNKEIKKITTVYTKIFKVNISDFLN